MIKVIPLILDDKWLGERELVLSSWSDGHDHERFDVYWCEELVLVCSVGRGFPVHLGGECIVVWDSVNSSGSPVDVAMGDPDCFGKVRDAIMEFVDGRDCQADS